MNAKLYPYLAFRGNAREAMEFYKSIFGGTLNISTFKEYQMAHDPSEENLVMHSQLETGNGIEIMASDTPQNMEYRTGTNFTMALAGDDEAKLSGYYHKLVEGGQVIEPLEKAPWGDTYGMLVDKFGVNWMVNISGPRQ